MYLIEHISKVLTVHPVRIIEPGERVHSAVAIILRETSTGLHILFIERSSNENDHWSGQIAFPGGKTENGDGSLRKTAERETIEELGLELATARYLGRLSDISPVGLPVVVSCFVYAVEQLPVLHINHNEVADVFWFPFREISNPTRYSQVKFPFRKRLKTFPALRLFYGKKPPLWGISYRLLRNLYNVANNTLDPDS
jgi:8-oxo-dGTP pyrophosphatase MutT (NUDIX family)